MAEKTRETLKEKVANGQLFSTDISGISPKISEELFIGIIEEILYIYSYYCVLTS